MFAPHVKGKALSLVVILEHCSEVHLVCSSISYWKRGSKMMALEW